MGAWTSVERVEDVVPALLAVPLAPRTADAAVARMT
jgi:hypothetical protein